MYMYKFALYYSTVVCKERKEPPTPPPPPNSYRYPEMPTEDTARWANQRGSDKKKRTESSDVTPRISRNCATYESFFPCADST